MHVSGEGRMPRRSCAASGHLAFLACFLLSSFSSAEILWNASVAYDRDSESLYYCFALSPPLDA
jgi:hypothetical protein